MRLLLDERVRADGSIGRMFVDATGAVFDDDARLGVLPGVAIARVMQRFGKPLEDAPAVTEWLALPGGGRLGRFRFHAIVDAEARDYLIWEEPGSEAVAALATTATAAIRHLATRLPQIPEGSGSGS